MANKYFAKKTKSADGKIFDSRAENRRWNELLWLEKLGKITNLQRQVKYDIIVNNQKICAYIADFTYNDETGLVVEDSKSEYLVKKDRTFSIKRKLMKAVHGIEIKITGKKTGRIRLV